MSKSCDAAASRITAPSDPDGDYVASLAKYECLSLVVANARLSISRTDEGLVVDIYPKDGEGAEPVASTYAFDLELDPDTEH